MLIWNTWQYPNWHLDSNHKWAMEIILMRNSLMYFSFLCFNLIVYHVNLLCSFSSVPPSWNKLIHGYPHSWLLKQESECISKLSLHCATLCLFLYDRGLYVIFCCCCFVLFFSCRLITLQYCSGFCHTLTWISHGFTCVLHSDCH